MGGGGGGKKGGGKQQVTDYYMSMHFGFSTGPNDALTGLKINEKNCEIPIINNTGADDPIEYDLIHKKELFGGPKEGGGVNGRLHIMFGNAGQRSPFALARRLLGLPVSAPVDATRNKVPGYRGQTSIFFTARDGVHKWSKNSKAGFIWGANYPSLPPVWATWRRAPKGLSGDPTIRDTISYQEETGKTDKNDEPVMRTVTREVHNANGAHIIYECLTAQWSLSHPPALIEIQSFLDAAQTLRNEEFGLSFKWENPTKIETFIGEVLDHISGTMAVNPKTGKFYLKLLRGDYDESTLLTITPDNALLDKIQRRSWGEIVNTVDVSWTNPANEQTETATAHDDAAMAVQGQEVKDTKPYTGIRSAKLAHTVALREVRMASRSLVGCTARVNRDAWSLIPGDVVKLHWPEEGIENMVMRVGPIDYGKPGDPDIEIELIEDIFGTDYTVYGDQATKWIAPGSDPAVLDHLVAGAVPYYLVANASDDERAQEVEFPETFTMLLCAQDKQDILTTDYLTKRPDITGVQKYFPDGSINNQSRGVLGGDLFIETRTNLFPVARLIGQFPDSGMLALIIKEDQPWIFELCAVESTTQSTIIVRRGVLDTVPQTWPAGTPVWFVDPETRIFDARARAVGEQVEYKFQPKTSRGQLPSEDAPSVFVTLDERQYRPYRPANVRVNGSSWGPLAVQYNSVLNVTWARRNRVTETSLALTWDNGDVAPENGQTTYVRLYRGQTLIANIQGIQGTSYELNLQNYYDQIMAGQTGEVVQLTLVVGSQRDGLDSLQAVSYTLVFAPLVAGWDRSWGFGWG